MMRTRHAAAVFLAAVALVTATAAEARSRHRHHARHMERTIPHRFVFPTPQDAYGNQSAAETLESGLVGDYGIPGATTADPYQHPSVGYDITGHYGPGYLYPD